MPSEPLILGFDTSAAHCAAALLCGDRVLAAQSEAMVRGQAERLMPLLQQLLTDAGKDWSDLDAIGVGIGPGNFTGIRISVSAARGLALALGIPAVGVSTFEAISLDRTTPHVPAVPAPRGQVYILPKADAEVQLVAEETPSDPPRALPPAGPDFATRIARIASGRWSRTPPRPAPLYVKPADAAPPRDPAPVILP